MKAIIKLKISVEDASRLQQAIDNIDRIQGIYEIKTGYSLVIAIL